MKQVSFMDAFLMTNPLYRGWAEMTILIGTGILGLLFSWSELPLSPYINILGGLIIGFGLWVHLCAEKKHKQAHTTTENINSIVTTGIYKNIRHPIYLSLFLINVGIALAFGIVLTLVLALATIFHWGFTAKKEEEFLKSRFPEYHQYVQSVRWRLIPGIF